MVASYVATQQSEFARLVGTEHNLEGSVMGGAGTITAAVIIHAAVIL